MMLIMCLINSHEDDDCDDTDDGDDDDDDVGDDDDDQFPCQAKFGNDEKESDVILHGYIKKLVSIQDYELLGGWGGGGGGGGRDLVDFYIHKHKPFCLF